MKKISLGNQNTHEGEEIENNLVSISEFESLLQNNTIKCPWTELCYRKAKEMGFGVGEKK